MNIPLMLCDQCALFWLFLFSWFCCCCCCCCLRRPPPPPLRPPPAPPRPNAPSIPACCGPKLWLKRTNPVSLSLGLAETKWKFLLVPGRFGVGKNDINPAAAGLMLVIWLLISGACVTGLINCTGSPEKSPERSAAVGTVENT